MNQSHILDQTANFERTGSEEGEYFSGQHTPTWHTLEDIDRPAMDMQIRNQGRPQDYIVSSLSQVSNHIHQHLWWSSQPLWIRWLQCSSTLCLLRPVGYDLSDQHGIAKPNAECGDVGREQRWVKAAQTDQHWSKLSSMSSVTLCLPFPLLLYPRVASLIFYSCSLELNSLVDGSSQTNRIWIQHGLDLFKRDQS